MESLFEAIWPVARLVLIVLAIIVLVVLIIVLLRAAKSMKDINKITAQAEQDVTPALKKVDPMVERAQLTLDTLNLELLRVDAILEDVESVTDVAGKTATTVDTITSAPTNAVVSLVDRMRGSLGSKKKAQAKLDRVTANPELEHAAAKAPVAEDLFKDEEVPAAAEEQPEAPVEEQQPEAAVEKQLAEAAEEQSEAAEKAAE